ncbi:hypothetical protein I4L69_001940 [Enterococcus faecium]|nr:hypothetical protein [Enterococcus faecium]
MPTTPHHDTPNGYSLRVSEHLPKGAANLAYVQADTPSPEKNLLISDMSSQIAENRITSGQKTIYTVFAKDDLALESEEGIQKFSRSDLAITDEYDVFSNQKAPLFYQASSKHLFDCRFLRVYPYIGGSSLANEKRFEALTPAEESQVLYNGDKITITKEKGKVLASDERYKIKLIKEGSEDFTYRIVVYADFRFTDESYEIHYSYWNGTRNIATTEILNLTPIFEEIPLNELQAMTQEQLKVGKVYAVSGSTAGGYTVYAPNPKLELSNIDMAARPAHTFEYKIEANLTTRVSDINPVELNVGLIYINDTQINQVNISSAAKKLFHKNPKMPEYLTFDNPHHTHGINIKDQYDYWLADLAMPREHWLDYDLIILSGYGEKDLTKYAENMKAFLDKGGTLLLDNCGSKTHVFNPVTQQGINTFINSISFSNTEENTGPRTYEEGVTGFQSRYFSLSKPEALGKAAPVIEFKGSESVSDWTTIIGHRSQGPAVIMDKEQYNGRLIISNAALMLDVLFNGDEVLKFFTNFCLYLAENQYIQTPYFKEHLYHRDNLFEKEYKDLDGTIVYVDDKHDMDQTQIVAKKILHENVRSKLTPYLPFYLQTADGDYYVSVKDDGLYEIPNSKFEKTNPNGDKTWEETTLSAIPNWDTVMFAGTGARFNHQSAVLKDGNYAIEIENTDAQAFWESDLGMLPAGKYNLSSWIRSESSNGGGVGLYFPDGTLFKATEEITGTFNWKEVLLTFELTEATQLLVRYGTHNKNNSCHLFVDEINLRNEGTILMNDSTNGNDVLYAYATSPKGEGLDLGYLNYKTEDIAIENIQLTTSLQIKSFVYQWSNADAQYKKEYGNVATHEFLLSKNKGTIELGKLISLVPQMNDGAEWADKSKVYYEISLLDTEENKYVNIELYDPSIQKYYYNQEGIIQINYNDLRYNSVDSTVVLRGSTNYYGLRLLSRKYAVQLNDRKAISVDYPSTKDERDRWYLRVYNGSFFKQGLTANDLEQLKEAGRENYYEDRLIGEHEYTIPEYEKQAFYPEKGERKIVAERAAYLDVHSIEVQRTPLLIREESVIKEPLVATNESRTVFQSRNNWWRKDLLPTIYWDEESNGNDVIVNGGYQINYEDGLVYLNVDELPGEFQSILSKGILKASYEHDNFKIFRRKYTNQQIKQELLTTRDAYTFHSKNPNWMTAPQPKLYRNNYSEAYLIDTKDYYIDHAAGTVTFFQETPGRIYVDYGFYTEEELVYTDADVRTGLIKLQHEISFKDEIYVSYIYQENYLEYKGYYNEEANTFVHLDLNPTTGHTFTSRQIIDNVTTYVELPTEKLLGKELYLYLLPSSSTYYQTVREEKNCLRHALSEEEWLKVKQTYAQVVLLAKIQVRENTDINNLIVMDARQKGGGIKESITQAEIEQRIGETSSFWDIGSFDGLAYYQNSVSVIELPASVLKTNGGQFTETDIEEMIRKYVAFGTFPIIEYKKD